MVFNYILKNETNEADEAAGNQQTGHYKPSKFLSRLNPKVFSYNFLSLSNSEFETYPWEIQVRPIYAAFENIVDAARSGAGYFGPGVTAASGVNQIITHSVPREHPVSLAAYQHSIANGLANGGEGATNIDNSILFPAIGHAIGNSLASSVIPKNRTESTIRDKSEAPQANKPLADHSYLANTALWDDWFLSGISPQTYPGFTSQRTQEEVAKAFFDQTADLPTQRYEPAKGGRDTAGAVSQILAATPKDDDALALPAAHIRVNGMFNVDSTSVEAWKAVLASLRNLPAPAQDASGKDISVSKVDNTPFISLITPLAEEIKEANLGDSRDANQWIGYRMLEDDEIAPLAEAIVKQIKLRGPFLSLADFVNRRVGDDEDLAVSGAIQAALDDPEAEVNATQINGRSINPSDRSGLLFPDAESGAASYGSPGYVKQADILTPMAPWISVRSDSFTIRAYGESKSSSGEVARAWCEATVERSPEFVDSANDRTTLFNDLNPTNRSFGRRFHITSFRWMNPSEIR